MPAALLSFLTVCCVLLLYLFLYRVVRAVWAELAPPAAIPAGGAAAAGAAPTPGRFRRNRNGSRLVVLEPKDRRGQSYELVDELTVGRAPGCAILLDDGYTSALHARIFLRDGRRLVEDLGSTNGTFLNAARVDSASVIRRGDRVKIGVTVLEVD